MRKIFPTEFIFSVFSLIIAFIIVHAFYIAVVRPNAETFLAVEKVAMSQDPNYVSKRSNYVIVKDYEQEACFIMMLWAFAILSYKWWNSNRQHKHLDLNFFGLSDEATISPSEVEHFSKRIPQEMKEFLLPRVLNGALERFGSTKNIQDASTEVHNLCEAESERLDSELSNIRYIAWAIPSVGFIGTVRGIGDALGQAHKAVEGDITGVTQSLGVAFNSTLIALLISIVLMFIIHRIQLVQERLVLDSKLYCNKFLISKFKSDA